VLHNRLPTTLRFVDSPSWCGG